MNIEHALSLLIVSLALPKWVSETQGDF